jgi:hypothetical protein
MPGAIAWLERIAGIARCGPHYFRRHAVDAGLEAFGRVGCVIL